MVKDDSPAAIKKNDKGEQVFVVNLPEDAAESSVLWRSFEKQMKLNKNKPFDAGPQRDLSTIKEDNCKEFRTKVILSWMLSNALLVVIFTNNLLLQDLFPGRDVIRINPYLTFLFWSVAGFSLVRFVGSVIYMIMWWKEKFTDAVGARSYRRGSNKV